MGTDPQKMPCTPNSTLASPFGDPNLQKILIGICTYVYLCTYVRPSEGYWADEFYLTPAKLVYINFLSNTVYHTSF